jgi:hypothetical protein
MGNNSSGGYTELINANQFNIDQSVRNRIASDCISNTKQNNMLQIVGSKVENLKVEQTNQVKNLCVLQTILENEKDTNTVNDVLSVVIKQLEEKGGLPGTAGKSNTTTKVYDQMRMNLDQSQINDITKNCIMNIKQDNVIQIFGSNVKNSDLTQINKGYVECLQNHPEITGMLDDSADAAKKELDDSMKIPGIDPTYAIIIVAIILISSSCCSSIIISLLRSNSS